MAAVVFGSMLLGVNQLRKNSMQAELKENVEDFSYYQVERPIDTHLMVVNVPPNATPEEAVRAGLHMSTTIKHDNLDHVKSIMS